MTKSVEPFVPANPDEITFYTCGPTVYDDAHIGNFRSFLAADLLRRWLESPLCILETSDGGKHTGPRRVVHVMNITDVGHMTDDDQADGGGEDKMLAAEKRIREAKKSGKLPAHAEVDPADPVAVAGFYRARFLEDARALGLKVADDAAKDPTLMPSATDHVDGMKRVIARLLDEGSAYAAGQPGRRAVYFDVQKADAYGRLSGNTLDRLRGGAGGRVDDSTQQEKRHPADFLLWKEDAAHKMKWPAPDHPALAGWGDGYPGWHIECTAMSLERLVRGGLDAAMHKHAEIDLHSGGEDNIFPHHECEIAQSCAFTGAPRFARHWFHPRFLMVEGQKMSKSKGTFYTPRDLMAKGIDPAAIRLELIKTHYRANADFSMQGLDSSTKRIERWRQFAKRLHLAVDRGQDLPKLAHDGWIHKFTESMSNDLNLSGALAALDIASKLQGVGSGSSLEEAKSSIAGVPSDSEIEHYSLPTQPMSETDIQHHLVSNNGTERHLARLHQVDHILGVIFRAIEKPRDTGIAVYLPGATPSDEVEQLLTQRRDAKKAKDFARADAIRDQLASMGYAVKDIAGGKVEVAPIN